MMAINTTLTQIINDKNISQSDLCKKLETTPNNLNNKLKRNNFPMRELVEIANAMELKLVLMPKESELPEGAYLLDYPEEECGLWKRKSNKPIDNK